MRDECIANTFPEDKYDADKYHTLGMKRKGEIGIPSNDNLLRFCIRAEACCAILRRIFSILASYVSYPCHGEQ